MSQPKRARRRDLRVLLEELARTPFERWEQHIQGLHLARRQGPRAQGIEYPPRCRRNWCGRRSDPQSLVQENLAPPRGWDVCQWLGGNPTAPRPERLGPPDRRPLPRWGGDQRQLPLDSHLIQKPCKASSGLERCRRLVPTRDAGLTLARRRQQRRRQRRDGGITRRRRRVAEA